MGWHPPILDALSFPFTTVTIIVNGVICYLLNARDIPFTSVAIASDSVFINGEYWRIITSAFSHYQIFHIVANIGSSWSCGPLEAEVGTIRFVIYIAILAISCGLLDVLIRHYFLPSTTQTWALGYSGVVCGLMAILSAYHSHLRIFGFNIRWSFMPFINILLIQLIVPRVSFIGHLSGVIVGFLISWNLFNWVTEQLFWNVLPWIVAFFFVNWARGHRDAMQWFSVSNQPPPPDVTVVNGRLERV
jgi:membrane associated rhomboid family serine protease